MPVAARSDEHESRLRPFPGARPPRRGQWTAGARRSPIAFVTAVKAPNDRRRGSQFSSWNISLPYRRYGWALFLCMALAGPTADNLCRLFQPEQPEESVSEHCFESCSARLQAGICLITRRPPEGGRYKKAPIASIHTDSDSEALESQA